MKLIERIRWIESNMKAPKLLVTGEEFKEVAEAIERKDRVIGSEFRCIIRDANGNVAYKEGSAIYTAPFGHGYLTSKLMVYKETKTAQKAIDKSPLLKGKCCRVEVVKITYEVSK